MPLTTLANAVMHWASRTFATVGALRKTQAIADGAQATARAAMDANVIDATPINFSFEIAEATTESVTVSALNLVADRFYKIDLSISGGVYEGDGLTAKPSNISPKIVCLARLDHGKVTLQPRVIVSTLDGDPFSYTRMYIDSIDESGLIQLYQNDMDTFTATEPAAITVSMYQMSIEEVVQGGYAIMPDDVDGSYRFRLFGEHLALYNGTRSIYVPKSSEITALEARVAALEAASTS